VETCIVENDGRAFGQFGQQDGFEPFIEYGTAAHAGKPEWGKQLSHQERGDDADAGGAVARTGGKAAFAFGATAIGIGFVVIDTGFVHPDTQMLRYFYQLLQESRAFLLVAFLVAIGLFFRLQPSFFTARHIAIWLTCSSAIAFQRSAICCNV
jgi:hypothetical protein